MSSLPFAPPGQQSQLPNNAAANKQFGRLLDALLILDAEGSCSIRYLADRVGLQPERLRHLLSVFMTAGADALEDSTPLTISFGTADGPLSAEEEDDAAQEQADIVWLETGSRGRRWLVSELGRRPVTVKDVARALLAASLVLSGDLPADRRAGVESLVARLSAGMSAVIEPPAGSVVHVLRDAIASHREVRFRYLHPWSGQSDVLTVEPYDLRRQRDRVVLDAGRAGELTSYDVSGLSEVEVLGSSFTPPLLPPRDARTGKVAVVLRVPAYSAEESRLEAGWDAVVRTSVENGHVEMLIELDGDLDDPGLRDKLGVLLLRLGPTVSVVSPVELRAAARDVGAKLLDVHGQAAG